MIPWIRIALFVIILSLSVGCATTSPPPTPTIQTFQTPLPTPPPTFQRLAPGDGIRIPVDPKPGPTEENPLLILHILAVDERTNAPLILRSVTLGDQEVAANAPEIEIRLPGHLPNILILRVEVDGYEGWENGFRQNLNSTRHVYLKLELRRKAQ